MYIVKINFRFKIILDVNGDKYLDAYELEAIFQYELDKIYDPNNPEVVSILFVVSQSCLIPDFTVPTSYTFRIQKRKSFDRKNTFTL